MDKRPSKLRNFLALFDELVTVFFKVENTTFLITTKNIPGVLSPLKLKVSEGFLDTCIDILQENKPSFYYSNRKLRNKNKRHLFQFT